MAASSRWVLEQVRRCATARREQFWSTMSWFVLERFVVRLADCAARDKLVLRGDLMIHALTGGAPPFEWRAELHRVGETTTADAVELVEEVCAATSEDCLRIEVDISCSSETLRSGVPRSRLFGLTGVLGATSCPVKLLIHEGEASSLQPTDYYFRSSIEGLEGGRLKACPPAVVMAHLLHGLIEHGIAPGRPASYPQPAGVAGCRGNHRR